MAKSFVVRAVLVFLLIPAAVSAAPLDDYYLSKFGEQAKLAKALRAVVGLESGHAERCRTPLYRSLKRDWEQLEPATQKTLAKVISKPTLLGERTCTPVGGHFTIHYATSGGDAPDPTDLNQNGVPDWVETVSGVFEYVYEAQVNKLGYLPPVDSTYDVYLRDLTGEGAYGFTTNDGFPISPATSVSSYIEIDRAFVHPMFTVGVYTPTQMLQITAAHEFHHAIQFTYNYYFDTWYGEVTSTWMEDEVYDSVNQSYGYLDEYIPLVDTVALNGPLGGNSEYGRWIFNRYLAETQGSRSVIRSIWEELGGTPAPGNQADIPMLPIIQSVIDNNLGNNFFGFAKKILLRDWATAHFTDIPLIPSRSLLATFTASGAVTAQPPVNVLAKGFTFGFYKYIPANLSGQPLVINMPNLSSSLAVSAFQQDSLGSAEFGYNNTTESITIPAFTPDSVVYLLICNNGGDMRNPVVVPFFPADDPSYISDGTGLDANKLVIPPAVVANSAPSGGGGGGGGGCFIATAAYGSYLHPKVVELRKFRDRQLLTNAPGRVFVSLYYRLSPPVARVIGEHDWMRGGVRLLLVPLVLAVEHPAAALMVLLLMVAGGIRRLAQRRRGGFDSVPEAGEAI